MDYKDENFQNSIINAINNQKLVLFVGAGFSKLCGLPLWDELASALMNSCVKEGLINHADKSQIERGKDSRTLITIAYSLFIEHNKTDAFWNVFKEYLSEKNGSKVEKEQRKLLIELIKKSRATVLTTNSDNILHSCFDDKYHIHYTESDLSSFKLTSSRHLVHLHGYIGEIESLVFTTDQYLNRYAKNRFRKTIESIFQSDYTILFMGYGLNELQLLDFLVNTKSDTANKFVLEGFYSYEIAQMKALELYYQVYKLKLVTYSKDEKDFVGMIDAFDYLITQAEKFSKARSNDYNRAIKIISEKPSIQKAYSLKNILITMNELEQDVLINNLEKSDYAVEWIIHLFKYEIGLDTIFNVSKKLKPAIQDGSHYRGVDFAGARIVSEVFRNNKNNKKLFEISKNLLLKIIEAFSKNSYLYTNHYIVGVIQRWIFSDYRLMNIQETFEFLTDEKSSYKTNNDWLKWIGYETSELVKCNKKTILNYVNDVLRNSINDKTDYYHFAIFVSIFGNEISYRFPKEIFTLINKILNDKTNRKYWFGYNDSLLILGSIVPEEVHTADEVLVIWFLRNFKYLDSELLEKNFNKWFSNEKYFYQKLAMYLLDNYFMNLKGFFFASRKNPLNNWNIYSEIYLIIKNHANQFSKNETETTINWIAKMKNYSVMNFYNTINKIDLFKVLLSSSAMLDENKKTQVTQYIYDLESSLTEEERLETISLPPPETRNKLVWTKSYTIEDDKNFIKKLRSTDAQGFVELISQKLNDAERHSVRSVFDDCSAEYNIFEWVKEDDFLKINKFPQKYLTSLMTLVLKSERPYPFDEIEAFFTKASGVLDAEKITEFNKEFMHHLYYSYLKNCKNVNENEKIQTFVLKFLNDSSLKWDYYNKYSEKHSAHNILLAEVYNPIGVLIITTYNAKNNVAINFLDSKLKSKNQEPIVKAIIAAHIAYIWNIDSNWLKKRIIYIFDNYEDDYNLSILGYSLTGWSYIEFIKLLHDKNLLLTILNSTEFSNVARTVIHNILIGFDGNEENINIIKTILQSNEALGGISIYSSVLSNTNDFAEYENQINIVLGEVSKVEFQDKKESMHAVIKLLKAFKKFTDKKHIWNAIMNLLSSKGNYYIQEVLELLKQDNITNEMIILFVKKYISNLTEHFYYIKEIVQLVELPNWDNKEKEKNELINLLGKTNPDFYTLFSNNDIS